MKVGVGGSPEATDAVDGELGWIRLEQNSSSSQAIVHVLHFLVTTVGVRLTVSSIANARSS
jgi:hypothetical protein